MALQFERVEFGSNDELRALIEAMLEGRRHPPGQRDDYAYQWLARLWQERTEPRALIVGLVTRSLRAPSARARSQAVRFFQSCPADDEGALISAFRDRPELFDEITDPIPGATRDLRGELMRAIARHPTRARAARTELRQEALLPGRGGSVALGLLQADAAWVIENAADIVAATPSTYTTFLVNLALLGRDVPSFVRRMRAVVPNDVAESILRERLGARPAELTACLEALTAPFSESDTDP